MRGILSRTAKSKNALEDLARFQRKPKHCGGQPLDRYLPHHKQVSLLSIFKKYGGFTEWDSSLPWYVRNTMATMLACRSGAFGSNHYQCDACGTNRILYNKCSDRHCPNCGRLARNAWLEKVIGWDLPTTFFQTTFTAPHQLNSLFAINQKECYDLFFRCVHTTLLERTEREFNCKPGIITALHTWGQRLFYHVHIHAIVTAGGESLGKGDKYWIGIDADAPQMEAKSLAHEFSGKFIDGLKVLYHQNRLEIPLEATWNYVEDQETFAYWADELLQIDWQAHSESTPETSKTQYGCIHYNGRYVRGGAINNNRIVDDDGMYVTFKYKDYRDNNQIKQERIRGEEFVARYVQHIVPKGLHRIRYGGLLTSCVRGKNLERARPLIREWNAANRDKLHPALIDGTYNTFEKDIENPEDLLEEKFETNPAPACLVCRTENMRHLGYRDAEETKADIRRLTHFRSFFSVAITTLDSVCEQINKEARRVLSLGGKHQQTTFDDFAMSRRLASSFSVVWSRSFERSADKQTDPMTIDVSSSAPSPPKSAQPNEISHAGGEGGVRGEITTSHFAIGQLVNMIGQAALIATMMDSVIDTLDGLAQSILSNVRKPSMLELFRSERIDEALTERWAENVDHRSVQLATLLSSTCTRNECCRGVPVVNMGNLPLPEW